MRACILTLVLIGCASSKGGAPTVQRTTSPGAHAILISIDGLLPETYLDPDAHGLAIPTLRTLARAGAVSRGSRSVFPSMTYPSHTSMATGVSPGVHGITTNVAWDPLGVNQNGWRWYAEDIRARTLWDTAAAADMRTALINWPVTVGAKATALMPEYWRAGTVDDAKLVRAMSTPGLLEGVAAEFPDLWRHFTPPVDDEAVADVAVHVLETQAPELVMLHMGGVDEMQHGYGVWSPQAVRAIEQADAQVARVIAAAKRAGTWPSTVLLLVSDHGFANISRNIHLGVLLAERGLVTLTPAGTPASWRASAVPSGGQAYIYLHDRADAATQRAVLDLIQPLVGRPGSGIRRLYTQGEIHARGGDPQAFLALDAEPGYGFDGGYRGERVTPINLVSATHGYDPERPEMLASLILYGPGMSPGRIEGARVIDVGPTLAAWLGLSLPAAEGSPLRILRPDAVLARLP